MEKVRWTKRMTNEEGIDMVGLEKKFQEEIKKRKSR
jgi:hypothetical protein